MKKNKKLCREVLHFIFYLFVYFLSDDDDDDE